MIVTRFAPSPTGYLHVGGARTALFNWLLARSTGGKFLLRIEDTDLARSTEKAVHSLLDDLRWLGLEWDNAELVYQSKRLPIYNQIIERMIAQGSAYKAWETAEELTAQRAAAEKQKRAFIYQPPKLTDEQLRQFESENRPHVVRFAMAVRDYRFDDLVLGKDQGVPSTQVQDFVIRKSDGMPTYHFAVVVDDAEMNITHVLRGQEHLLNTVNHIALQESLGYSRPHYAHLPIILNLDGSKMGKRDRDKKVRAQTHNHIKNTKKSIEDIAHAGAIAPDRLREWLNDDKKQLDPSEHALLIPIIGLKRADLPEILVHDFRENGYIADALINFLALLGWNPGDNRELMPRDELIRAFKIEQVGKANSKFDRAKLLSFNTSTAATMDATALVASLREYLRANPDSALNQATDEKLIAMLKMKAGFRTLREVDESCRFMLLSDEQIVWQPDAVEKVLRKNNEGLTVLRDLLPILSEVSDWTHDALEAAVKSYCDQKQLALGKVAQPIRVAISGGTISPPIFHSLEFLGKSSSIARMTRCVA